MHLGTDDFHFSDLKHGESYQLTEYAKKLTHLYRTSWLLGPLDAMIFWAEGRMTTAELQNGWVPCDFEGYEDESST